MGRPACPAAHPIQGSQFTYAVVAATKGVAQARASIELKVIVESTIFGHFTYGTPEEARAHTRFAIP